MKHFIPYKKLSKREQKARNGEQRVSWGMCPVTRRPPNPRAYNRKKIQKYLNEVTTVSFFIHPYSGQKAL